MENFALAKDWANFAVNSARPFTRICFGPGVNRVKRCRVAISSAAQKLGRRWMGIDITHLSIALQKYRLKDMFRLEAKKDYVVVGEPEDLSSAQQLAEDDRYQFQWWALSLVKARPVGSPRLARQGQGEGKKGSDKGIDGVITFIDDATGKPKRALVQVKSGHVKAGDLRDLRGTLERENAALGVFVTLDAPSDAMKKEAVAAGILSLAGLEPGLPSPADFDG